MYEVSKIGRHFTSCEFFEFREVELSNIRGLRCIVFHFRQEAINIF